MCSPGRPLGCRLSLATRHMFFQLHNVLPQQKCMETTEQVLKITNMVKNIRCLVSKACRLNALHLWSSPCIACLSSSLNHPPDFMVLPHHSRKAFPHQLDPLLLGPTVPNVMLTVMQDSGGPRTWLSDSSCLLQLSEPFCSTVNGDGLAVSYHG